jgi:hypothetical protein
MNIFNRNKLLKYINNYDTLLIDQKQKGSIFTKTNLIYKKLKLLPRSVWTNPNLKWLDPGCGIGNYLVIVYYKLMNNIPIYDIEKRRRHILENMLYFVELNEKYVEEVKEIFCSDKYKLNIFCGSYVYLHTLDETIPVYNYSIFNTKFDIIVGNPPYQKSNKIDNTKLSAKPLYHLFVKESINNLVEDGYLLFIHPYSWRRKSKEIKVINDILNKKLIYIYTNNNFKEFKLSAPFINYYLLQNTSYDKKHMTRYNTVFNNKSYIGSLHLNNNLEYIPGFLTKTSLNIIQKMINKNGDKFDVQLESKLNTEKKNISKDKSDEFKYLNLHTYSKKHGRVYRYSNKKHPCHDKLKILMNFKGGYNYLDPHIDNGTMGITDNSMRLYVNNNNKNLILSFFESKLLKFLLYSTTYNYGANQKNEFHIINTFTIPINSDFYKYYDINKTEIKFINSIFN